MTPSDRESAKKRVYNKTYYERHKDAILARNRERYAADPERRRARSESHAAWRAGLSPERQQEMAERQTAYYEREKDAINARQRERYAADTEYRRAFNIRNAARRYGFSTEQYLEMFKRQGGRCAVCERVPENRALHVDHDHNTGQVRALLCHHCNTALGLLNEDAGLLERLKAYVLSWETESTVPRR